MSMWEFIKRISLITTLSMLLVVVFILLERSGPSFLHTLLMYVALEFYFYWRTKIVANKIE